MKYVWIIILAIILLIGWIYVINDIIITFKEFRIREAFFNLDDISYAWFIGHIIALFVISIICYIIY